jgi:bifunctional non-homologous end joining protein LigD
MAKSKQTVTVEGHRLTLTNLDKVLYPATGTTKADVIAYYAEIAPVLLPHVENRPATRKRWVHGVGTADEPGEVFFQKNLDSSAPSWVKRRPIEHKNHTNEYPLVNDVATLTWLGQIAALEIHVPQWKFGRNGAIRNPDRIVLDLDPGDGVGLLECVEVARLARTILKGMGLEPVPVTSGSKGIHLYAGLDGKQTSDQISAVAHELARALEADHPDLVVSDMKKALRVGKVLVDWSQNNAAKTTIAPYSLRGRAHPFVAVPRTWRELASPDLAQLDYEQVLKRMKRRADPLAILLPSGTTTDAVGTDPDHVREQIALAEAKPADRLHKYRSMRDASKTPEPIPDAVGGTEGNSFVIQEHHARRLHYDFRLERDGVLVSWAVPKGVPTDGKKNHLAVQTEDHPIEYGSFEGTIPAGEYGGGEVTIWDSGTYELEKWRDDKEVIVVLHGEDGGGLGEPTKVALIHTGGEGKASANWLMHRMSLEPKARTSPTTQKRTPSRAPIKPMLATLGDESDLTSDDEWAFEMKWDGIRAIAHVEPDGTVLLRTRNGNDVTVTYPEVVDGLRASVNADQAILDGEIVAVDGKARPDFGLLQTRMGLTKKADVERAAKAAPVQYLVFDLLEWNNKSFTGKPYDERRTALMRLVTPKGAVQVPPEVGDDLDQAIRSSHDLRLEGVMAKKRDSTYTLGRRSRAWIKIKHHLTQEVVIGGWRPGRGRRSGVVGSLLLGVPGKGGLDYVGRVGTGFGDRELEEIMQRLAGLEQAKNPFVDVPRLDASDATWVKPQLVGEVEFAEWTSTGRLRAPSWRGWREDKSPKDVVREQ